MAVRPGSRCLHRDNWYVPQIVRVTAPDDFLAEGERNIPIQHTVIQGVSPKDGGAYDGIAVLGVPVTVIDNDTAEVLIVPFDEGNEAGPNSLPDTYDTVVAEDPAAPQDLRRRPGCIKRPTGDVVVNLAVVGNEDHLARP
jgi:hypothetical protein